MSKKEIKKGQIVQVITDGMDPHSIMGMQKIVMNVEVKSYNKETGKIIGTKVNDRTIADPTGTTNKIVITHKDEVRAWLA
tara:strand:+ start:44 stop:283 length:240 start_codon:yes stop_codon:yes gene_type:complete